MNPFQRVTVAAVVAVVTSTACSGDAAVTTTSTTTPPTSAVATTVVSGDFVFGSGTLPESIPEDFPIPNGGRVDSTLVNTVTGYTEASILIPAEVDIAALFFEQNLLARDYEYGVEQQQAGTRWVVTWAKSSVSGTIDITNADAGITRATVIVPGDD